MSPVSFWSEACAGCPPPACTRERYYGKRFNSREELVAMIEEYIYYYNNERYQRRFGVLTPIEKYNSYLLAA